MNDIILLAETHGLKVRIQIRDLTAFIQAEATAEIGVWTEDDSCVFVMKKDLFNFCIEEF